MTVLTSGGAGFIESNFIPYFLSQHKGMQIVNLDKLTYAGKLSNLKEVSNNKRYTFVQGEICDRQLIEDVAFKKGFINKDQLLKLAELLLKSGYGKYLQQLV